MKNNRITLIMTLAVLAGFGIILMMNMAALMGFMPSRYISPNAVRGIAVEHNKLLYTLNFAQQGEMIDLFNRSIPVSPQEVQPQKTDQPLEVTRIIIYRFNAPDIEIRPIAYVNKTTSLTKPETTATNLVFEVPEWNPKGFLEEAVPDEFHKLLLNTYDH